MGQYTNNRRHRHALRRAVDSIVAALADGHMSLESADRALDLAGCPVAAACRVCLTHEEIAAMMYEIATLDCQCPRCGHLTTLRVDEAAVDLPLHDRCLHCGADFAVTTIAIGIHHAGGEDEPTISVNTITERT